MIEQMLVLVVLDRQRELRRTQKLVDPLGGRDAVVGAHTLTVFMAKPWTKRGNKRNAKADGIEWNFTPTISSA